MGKRHGGREAGSRELDEMIESVEQMLLEAVGQTLSLGSPAPARDQINRMIAIDEDVADGGPGPPPGETFALIVLTRWLGAHLGCRVDADDVLGWIGDNLGTRCRLRSKYMIGMLDSGSAGETVELYADALGDDFLPVLVWIAAALVARYGDGDPAALSRAVPAESRARAARG